MRHLYFDAALGEIKTITPSVPAELTIGQVLDLERIDITGIEALSILSGLYLDDLYMVNDISHVNETTDLIVRDLISNLSLTDTTTLPWPATIKIKVRGKMRTISLATDQLSIMPVGYHLAAQRIIENEVNAFKEVYGLQIFEASFRPSVTACSMVIECFLQGVVMNRFIKGKFSSENCEAILKKGEYSRQLTIFDGLALAQYYFLNYPNFNKHSRPSNKIVKYLSGLKYKALKTLKLTA